jgi:hypothetical protein
VRRAHPRFNRTERVFRGLTSSLHSCRIPIKARPHFVEHLLMLPATDSPVVAGRAF